MTWSAYVTESDADSYHTAHGAPTAWSGATSSEKTLALLSASEYLDQAYGTRWVGLKASTTQSREWPRTGAEDRAGNAFDDDEIPTGVEDSTSYLALEYINNGNLMPVLDYAGIVKVQRDKIGPLESETEYVGGQSQSKVYGVVDGLLLAQGLIRTGSSVVRA